MTNEPRIDQPEHTSNTLSDIQQENIPLNEPRIDQPDHISNTLSDIHENIHLNEPRIDQPEHISNTLSDIHENIHLNEQTIKQIQEIIKQETDKTIARLNKFSLLCFFLILVQFISFFVFVNLLKFQNKYFIVSLSLMSNQFQRTEQLALVVSVLLFIFFCFFRDYCIKRFDDINVGSILIHFIVFALFFIVNLFSGLKYFKKTNFYLTTIEFDSNSSTFSSQLEIKPKINKVGLTFVIISLLLLLIEIFIFFKTNTLNLHSIKKLLFLIPDMGLFLVFFLQSLSRR